MELLMQYIYNVEHAYLKCWSVIIWMLNFQKLFEKSKYIHIGSCSVAKIPNNIVVQMESKMHLRFERKLKSKSQIQKGTHPISHCTLDAPRLSSRHVSSCCLMPALRWQINSSCSFCSYWICTCARILKQKLYKILPSGRYIGSLRIIGEFWTRPI